MHGQLMNDHRGPVTRAPLFHDPGRPPLESTTPPNLSLNCFGNAMCTAPFTPLPKKKSTFQVPDEAYRQALKGVVKNGVIQTLAGPVDDYVNVMPPPTGNYGQDTGGRRLKYLQGNVVKTKEKKAVSFCGVGEAENFVEVSAYQEAQQRLNQTYLLNDLQPCNTGIHESLYDRKISGGHGMMRFVPGMPFKNVATFQHTGNPETIVDAQMNRSLQIKCHNGEVRSNHHGAAEGLVKQAFTHQNSQSKGFDVEEVLVDRRAPHEANVLKASKVDSQTSRISQVETSLQTSRHLQFDVRKGLDTDVASNQPLKTGKRTGRFANLDMIKKNPLFNQQHREGNFGKRHHAHQTFQVEVAATSNKQMAQNRTHDSTMRISSRKPAPSLTDAFNGEGYVAGESGVMTNRENTHTRANPLYYSQFRMGSESPNRKRTRESQFDNNVKVYAKSGVAYTAEPPAASCD